MVEDITYFQFWEQYLSKKPKLCIIPVSWDIWLWNHEVFWRASYIYLPSPLYCRTSHQCSRSFTVRNRESSQRGGGRLAFTPTILLILTHNRRLNCICLGNIKRSKEEKKNVVFITVSLDDFMPPAKTGSLEKLT